MPLMTVWNWPSWSWIVWPAVAVVRQGLLHVGHVRRSEVTVAEALAYEVAIDEGLPISCAACMASVRAVFAPAPAAEE